MINFLSRITSEESGEKSFVGASRALHVITYKTLVDTVQAGNFTLLKSYPVSLLAEVTRFLSQKQRPLLLTLLPFLLYCYFKILLYYYLLYYHLYYSARTSCVIWIGSLCSPSPMGATQGL